jgi:hypothetical protein
MAELQITEFTDPACPFAWSAEPQRRRLEWLYGNQLGWDVRSRRAWAGEPLASIEVATVCGIELDDARERLGRVAAEQHLGFDGLWSLPDWAAPEVGGLPSNGAVLTTG